MVEKEVSFEKDGGNKPITFVILGASGDLAKKKTFPALFQIFINNLLPPNCTSLSMLLMVVSLTDHAR